MKTKSTRFLVLLLAVALLVACICGSLTFSASAATSYKDFTFGNVDYVNPSRSSQATLTAGYEYTVTSTSASGLVFNDNDEYPLTNELTIDAYFSSNVLHVTVTTKDDWLVIKNLTVRVNYSYQVPITYYTVTFDLNGGSRTGGGALSQQVAAGGSATAPTMTPPTGKVFDYWDKSFTNVQSNITVKAIWKDAPVVYYTVTFDPNGGVRTGGGELVQQVAAGGSATAPTVSRSGYTYKGWDKVFANVQSDMTVKAQWELYVPPITYYTVTFDLDGGSRLGGGSLSQSIAYGGSATAPTVSAPEGKEFDKWDKSFSYITGNTTVTAIWKTKMLTITLMDGSNVIDTIEVEYGTTIVSALIDAIPANMAVESLTMQGVTFNGFSEDAVLYSNSVIQIASIETEVKDYNYFDWIMGIAGGIIVGGILLLIGLAVNKKGGDT